jgi:hypothetical protein
LPGGELERRTGSSHRTPGVRLPQMPTRSRPCPAGRKDPAGDLRVFRAPGRRAYSLIRPPRTGFRLPWPCRLCYQMIPKLMVLSPTREGDLLRQMQRAVTRFNKTRLLCVTCSGWQRSARTI